MSSSLVPGVSITLECPECTTAFTGDDLIKVSSAFQQHAKQDHPESAPQQRCGRCTAIVEEYDDPMYAVKVEIGFATPQGDGLPYEIESSEEGWEKFVVPMCVACWNVIRDRLNEFIYGTLLVDKRKVFGSWSFYNEFDGEEQPLEENRGPAPTAG